MKYHRSEEGSRMQRAHRGSGWAAMAAAMLVVPGAAAPAGRPAAPRRAPAKPAARKAAAPSPVLGDLGRAREKGLRYLRSVQKPDGSWQDYPGVTAVCALAFLRSGVAARDPAVERACRYLAGLAKPNGAIYSDRFGPAQALPNYNTALALTALHASGDPRYREIIGKAQEFLTRSQFDEEEGYAPRDRQYGGIGYGSKEDNPDVSNLQNALEALRESGYSGSAEVFRKALIFLQRCQNRADSNDQAWAGTDGGFVYASSGESKADEYTRKPHSSYGSMTYAGVKSYLYCRVSKSDPRVQSAWSWLRANYDVTQNPRMGSDGLYYYFHTMSKTLALWGDKVFMDARGNKHIWAADLARELVRRQNRDGSWANKNPRWWEDRSELVTGYALLTLAHCRQGL